MKEELTRFENALDIWNEKKRRIKDKSPIFGLRLFFYRSGEDPSDTCNLISSLDWELLTG